MTTHSDSAAASSAVAARLRQLRRDRDWSVRQLAEHCATKGFPWLTSSVLENIERGRPKDGQRRREISVGELLVFAEVFEVHATELLPELKMPTRPAPDALPRLHTPDEIAKALGCSAWWVKEQARQRRIPFVLVGAAYRFTTGHLDSIIQIFEQQPQSASPPARQRVRSNAPDDRPVPKLQARPPRRSPKSSRNILGAEDVRS